MTHALSHLERLVVFLSLSLATFMMVLDYSIANISIPYIAGALAVSVDQGTYVITSFAVGNAIGLAMTGWLAKRIGTVKLISLSLILFTLFSLFCGFSFSLNALVINRFLQGLVAGPVIPLSQSLLITQGTPTSRSRDLAIWATIIVTAPVFGPILGGYISDWYSWEWIFYINIPVGIFCVLSLWLILRDRESPTEKTPVDLPGMILLSVGVTCLQIFLDKGQDWDWWNSYWIRALSIGSVICFTFLIIRELSCKNPLLNLRLFSIPAFSISIICLLVSYAIYFGTIVIVPLWLQEYMNYHVEWAGIAVAALGAGPLLLGLFIPMAMKKLGVVPVLSIGFFLFGLSCFYTAFFTTNVDIQHVAFSRFLFGLGFSCYINPLITLSMQGIEEVQLPNATGIFHFTRALMGAVGTSVFTTLWTRRTIFYHFRIGEQLTLSNPFTPRATDLASLDRLDGLLDQQAAMLAINDVFYLMAWLYMGLVAILAIYLFFQRKAGTPVVAKVHLSGE